MVTQQQIHTLGQPWGAPGPDGRSFAKDPSVVRFGGRFLLYLTLPPGRSAGEGERWSIGVAESDDLVDWSLVRVLGAFGEYDAAGAAAPGAVVIGDRVHLFFQTYGTGSRDAICHASSADGIDFAPHPGNPVLRAPLAWSCGRAIDADAVLYGDRLLLAYATRDPDMRVQMVGTATAAADSGFGPEAWTHLTPDGPALRPELPWEQDCIEAPALTWDGERFGMFYAGAYNNAPQQIGWATSTDGATWERGSTEPLLPNGAPGTWNSSESGHPGTLVHNGDRYLFFQGNDDNGRSWRIAATPVTLTASGPVLTWK
ncbi:glycoside hydrolase [Streptomyces triticagri]|uniref:Glycoside hydrolase n=1 Tax=Streptomyces triticagri TaxID=2293568 RepID=A0A372M0E0_9ACTN|nr:glycoside hydrolase [Streptomyces triticagri]RFU84378.1 glycoside hydrolase [Streptomyces triticagri]